MKGCKSVLKIDGCNLGRPKKLRGTTALLAPHYPELSLGISINWYKVSFQTHIHKKVVRIDEYF